MKECFREVYMGNPSEGKILIEKGITKSIGRRGRIDILVDDDGDKLVGGESRTSIYGGIIATESSGKKGYIDKKGNYVWQPME